MNYDDCKSKKKKEHQRVPCDSNVERNTRGQPVNLDPLSLKSCGNWYKSHSGLVGDFGKIEPNAQELNVQGNNNTLDEVDE